MGIVRLFLAFVVVADHFYNFVLKPIGVGPVAPLFKAGLNAGFAVMFFFMISGFLISFVLSRKYDGSASGIAAFYQSRFVRIFSLYWPVLIVFFIVFDFTRQSILGATPADLFSHIFILGTELRYSLVTYPVAYQPAMVSGLSQAWTLGPELMFYLLAPFLLPRPVLMTVILVASLALRVALIQEGNEFDSLWRYHLLPSTICFFLLGHSARVLSDRFPLLGNGSAGLAFLAASVGAMLIPDLGYRIFWDTPRFFLAVFAFAACLPGLFALTKDIGWMNKLGNLSFGVYLLHLGPIVYLQHYAAPESFAWLPKNVVTGYVLTFGLFALVVAAAWAFYTLLEKPTAKLMNRVIDRAKRRRTPRLA